MVISIYDAIQAGGDNTPPHLLASFQTLEEAAAEFAASIEDSRAAIWRCADIVAAAVLRARAETSTEGEARRATADTLRYFAGVHGDRDVETMRRWMKCAVVFPPERDGETVRVPDRPLNLYLAALAALNYGGDPVRWVLDAIDDGWSVSELTQRIRAFYADGPRRVVTYRTLFDHSIPVAGGAYNAAIQSLIAEAVYNAFHSPYQAAGGAIESIEVRIVARRVQDVMPLADEMVGGVMVVDMAAPAGMTL